MIKFVMHCVIILYFYVYLNSFVKATLFIENSFEKVAL